MTAFSERVLIALSFAGLAAAVMIKIPFSSALLAVCLLIEGILILYAVRAWNRTEVQAIPLPAAPWHGTCLILLTLSFTAIVSLWGISRVIGFATPTYDFGIFAQMFHSMKTNGLPMTTLERDGLLSHFHVHVSPIYYLMLPFYMLIPHPATLQVMQAAVLASAVVPLWLLGRAAFLSGIGGRSRI